MKKLIIIKKISVFLFILLLIASCKKLEDLNENIKDPSVVSGESLFTGAQKNLFDQMVNSNVNNNISRLIVQYWAETTYPDETRYNLDKRSIPDNHWDILYRDVLKDLNESAKIINATDYTLIDPSPKVKTNKLALIEVMSVYTWSVLVETFGDIPYSGAINTDLHSEALDINIPLPKYDDGLLIYKDLIARLDAAIANMDPAFGSFDNADNMYNGDITQWIKFSNSLKLRMGLLLADVDNSYAQTIVQDAAANVFTSNADNGRIIYLSSQPNTNPIYDDLVASGRHDFVPTVTIIDSMKSLGDPRMPFYFTLIDTSTSGTPVYTYLGGRVGRVQNYSSFSHVADGIQIPTFEGTILDYPEVEFLLAEAVERGYSVGGTAESHYNAAITASIKYWSGSTVPSDSINAYLLKPAVAYTTAPGTYKQKIGIQMWIALYNRGFEAWTEWRKFDYPVLVKAYRALSDIPVRYTYPIEEQTLNGANRAAAASAIGGDDVSTKLFWDKF
jgi:hypothetical protein